MHFAALELHSATPIAWIFSGLTHLDFINPGHKSGSDLDWYPGQWVIQVSSSDPFTTLFCAEKLT